LFSSVIFLSRALAGRTIFITGASRGIGKAIAIKAARDGANIVIAAKTAEPHPKLPGTIYTAAKEGMQSQWNQVIKHCMAQNFDGRYIDTIFNDLSMSSSPNYFILLPVIFSITKIGSLKFY